MHADRAVALLFVAVFCGVASSARGEGGADPVVPDSLRPWTAWVLRDNSKQAARCPSLAGTAEEEDGEGDLDEGGGTGRVCSWPAVLSLSLGDRGGTFTQEWEVFKSGLAVLPGDADHWPLDVKLDGRPTPVVNSGDVPAVELPAGRHVLGGRFAWDSLPESLGAPTTTGLVALTVNGKKIDFPLRDEDGQVFLGRKEGDAAGSDAVELTVHRKISDDVPLLLTTRLLLAISGKSRELVLGKALPAGFEPMAVKSELPVRFEPDGRVRMQVRPGNWTIDIESRRVAAEKSLTRPDPDGLWKEGDEAWVFEARPDLRVVTVEGVPAIDPTQTTLPEEWKALPAYAMGPGATMTLSEQRRGDAEPPPDRLSLARQLWLDFDGGGYSVSDRLSGQFSRAWRLEMAEGTKLGRVSIDGRDQFITRLGPAGSEGVEIRIGRANIDADSRIEGRRFSIPATSFAHDFDKVMVALNVPVGWRLLHVGGADKVSGSWIERWSLRDLFLLLLVALAVGRLYGWRSGAIALGALGLTVVEEGAPVIVWLLVILSEALVRALGEGKLLKVVRAARVVVWLAFAVITIPFAIGQVRSGIHPAAETGMVADSLMQNQFGAPEPAAPMPQAAPPAPEEQQEARIEQQGIQEDGLVSEEAKPEQAKRPAPLRGKMKVGDLGEQSGKGNVSRSMLGSGQGKFGSRSQADKVGQYDASIVVQTGQGLPHWQSQRVSAISFNGPVTRGQKIQLYLVPPWLNTVLALARVGLLAVLAWLLLRRPLRLHAGWFDRKPLVAGLAMLALVLPLTASAADFPTQEVLDQLREHLLKNPECAPNCASIGDLVLDVTPAEVRLRLQVSAAARTAVPLPGDAASWSPASVRVDGRPASALYRSGDGMLWLALEKGVFTVELSGPIPGGDTVQIPLPMRPRHVVGVARGFVVEGIHEDGAADESIVLYRETKNGGKGEGDASTAAPALPPFLSVERTLLLGLKWEVATRVIRQTPAGSPIVIVVPLLPGESVTTPGIRIEKGQQAVSLSFSPSETEIEWQSTLAENPEIRLRSDPVAASRWSETWRVVVGPTWHSRFSGIPPVHRTDEGAERIPEWRPWPGEELTIALSKPAGVEGQTLTVDSSSLTVMPGVRNSQMDLTLVTRSSRGTEHKLLLPLDAKVESVTANGKPQPIRRDGRSLTLTITPGKQSFGIVWSQPVGLSTLFRVPEVELRLPSTNSEVHIDLARAERWLLWLSGPRMGPSVHFWSVVVVLLLLGWALARSRLTPLHSHDWVLLGLGLLQLDFPEALIVPICLVALGWRARRPAQERAWVYDLGQIAVGILVVASLITLVAVLQRGLLEHPDMRVMGNGSNARSLVWYQDRAGSMLPRPWMFSVSRRVYQIAMLAWALWLAAAGIRWARWTWECMKQNGVWKPIRKEKGETPQKP